MSQNAIDFIFDELKTRGLCSSRSSYSSDWLGRETSYYRSLQCKGREPSIEAQLNLAARLRSLGAYLEHSDHPTIATSGKVYLKLSHELLEALLARAEADTADAAFNLVSQCG